MKNVDRTVAINGGRGSSMIGHRRSNDDDLTLKILKTEVPLLFLITNNGAFGDLLAICGEINVPSSYASMLWVCCMSVCSSKSIS
jgi:hypothetical protein